MIDCLIIGYNDYSFPAHVGNVRSMDGGESGVYKDLRLAFVEHEGMPYRALDIFTKYHNEGRGRESKRFHNMDFLFPTIPYLGTYLNRRGYSFDYINLFQEEKDALAAKLREGAMTVAITTTLYVTPLPILEIMQYIRQISKDVKIIIGGPFVSNQAAANTEDALKEMFGYIGADIYVINQEGEQTLAKVLDAIKQGKPLDGISNIAFAKDGMYEITPALAEDNSLGANMPDYSLFNSVEYGEFVSIRTAKSCPFRCAFCGFPQRAGKYKYVSVEEVEREMDAVKNIGGVTTLTILDDTFNVPRKRFREILKMMIRKRYGFKWNSFYRSDHGDSDTIGLMKEAGCEGVFLGAESASDEMLKRMNKTSRRKDYLAAISALKQEGIVAHVGFIIGFPGETQDTARQTADFIEEASPDFFRAQLWYCDPVTPIWKKSDEYKIKGAGFNWSHATMNSKEASAIVDSIFLGVQNSIWMPQYGFELWSVFYLQRMGMTLQQVKVFMKLFNSAIKDQLLRPDGNAGSARIMENLKLACQHDRGAAPDQRVLESIDREFNRTPEDGYKGFQRRKGIVASRLDEESRQTFDL